MKNNHCELFPSLKLYPWNVAGLWVDIKRRQCKKWEKVQVSSAGTKDNKVILWFPGKGYKTVKISDIEKSISRPLCFFETKKGLKILDLAMDMWLNQSKQGKQLTYSDCLKYYIKKFNITKTQLKWGIGIVAPDLKPDRVKIAKNLLKIKEMIPEHNIIDDFKDVRDNRFMSLNVL